MRYIVFEVGCLECSDNGSCYPAIKSQTDDVNAAFASAKVHEYSSQADRFVFDTHERKIVEA